jgi:WD40 repeat protein
MTPDGRRGLSCSWDGTVKVWDAERATLVTDLTAHTDRVHAVAVSPDGTQAASASADRTVRVWSLDNYRELATLVGHEAEVTHLAFTRQGRVVSASRDGTLRLWNAAGLPSLPVLEGHEDWITDLVVDDARGVLYSCAMDRTVRAWSLETGGALGAFYGQAGFTCIALSPDAVYVGDEAGQLLRLELAAGALKAVEPTRGRSERRERGATRTGSEKRPSRSGSRPGASTGGGRPSTSTGSSGSRKPGARKNAPRSSST